MIAGFVRRRRISHGGLLLYFLGHAGGRLGRRLVWSRRGVGGCLRRRWGSTMEVLLVVVIAVVVLGFRAAFVIVEMVGLRIVRSMSMPVV